jgi:phytoene desaturase
VKKAVVIGSGVAGIASSIRLRNLGFEVDVFEKNQYLGGKLTVFSKDGFRFDAGPSLFTLPKLVDDLFEISGRNPRESFNYLRLEKTCHYFFEDGTSIFADADVNKFALEIENKVGVEAQTVLNHLQKSQLIYDKTKPVFLEQSLHQFKNYFSKSVLLALADMHKMDIFSTLNEANERALKNSYLVQIFNRFATYNGSNPYKAPGIMNVIPHLEHGIGAFFPKGGMHEITNSLVKLAKDLGVNFHLNTEVEKILVDEKKHTKGIIYNGKTFLSDLVVCNSDVHFAYRKLMPEQKAPEKALKRERSSSALIFYWGIGKEFKNLDVHNIFFSSDYKKEFDYIFSKHDVFDDPTVYIHISSKIEKKDAPKEKENWFVMINVPSNKNQNWENIIEKARKNILTKLSRMLNADIEKLIETEEILNPLLIESKTNSFAGSLYGTSSNDKFAAFLRHPNFSSEIKNLYFVGGSVHPGGGIPLCLLSAKIACEMIAEKN